MAPKRPRPEPDLPLLFTVPRAAQQLGVSPKTLWRLIAARQCPHVRLSGKVYVPRLELQNFLAQLPSCSAAEALRHCAAQDVVAGYRAEIVETSDSEEAR